jgi:acetyl esterase/lipase
MGEIMRAGDADREGPYPVTVVRDQPYAEAHGVSLLADLFLPQGAGAPVPVVVWVHGGGWRFGNRRLAPDLSRFFARRGLAMASIDYRLSGQALFPAQIEDVKAAIRWLRGTALAHGLDGARIGILGSSAGGHLAALAGLTPHGPFDAACGAHADQPADVQAVVDAYGPTDFLQIDAHRPPDGTPSADPETLLLPPGVTRSAQPDSFESYLLGAPIESVPDRVRTANPVSYARPGAPPFLILHGTSDTTVPVHQSELLYDALAAHDNDVTLGLIDGIGHGFLNRTHLDDRCAWTMTVRRHVPGAGERAEEIRTPVFGLIETFFRSALMGHCPSALPFTAP